MVCAEMGRWGGELGLCHVYDTGFLQRGQRTIWLELVLSYSHVGPGIQTLALALAQQALYPLTYLPGHPTGVSVKGVTEAKSLELYTACSQPRRCYCFSVLDTNCSHSKEMAVRWAPC